MQIKLPLKRAMAESTSSAPNATFRKRGWAYKKIWVSRKRRCSWKLESERIQICAYCRCRLDNDDLESTTGSNSVPLKRQRVNSSTKKKPEAKILGNNKGLPHYDLMADVFWDSGAQGSFARSSKESPLIDAEERDIARRQRQGSPSPSIPDAVEVSNESDDMDETPRGVSVDMVTSGSKRKIGSTSDGDRSCGEKKLRSKTAVQQFEAWSNFNRRSKAKLDDYLFKSAKGDATNTDPYSMTKCIQLLEQDCGPVPPHVHVNAYNKFTNPDFREAWVNWPKETRVHVVMTDFMNVKDV